MKKFYSNGKLLLTGEYVVLDGALALAIPTKYGQSLTIEPIDELKLIWKSLDNEGAIWFEDEFLFSDLSTGFTNHSNEISNRLIEILKAAKQLNPDFLNSNNGFKVTTQLDFPKNWGLGTSSTLINNIADWATINPYNLLELTFGGSGYDIACAKNNYPITYLLKENNRVVDKVDFNPTFKDHLYFVYLNKKQNSREGILHYKAHASNLTEIINKINTISLKIVSCTSLNEFESLINAHEQIISETINQTPIKAALFSDFNGSIKSLGAWGGDFVLVTSKVNPVNYFKMKGYTDVIPYSKMIL